MKISRILTCSFVFLFSCVSPSDRAASMPEQNEGLFVRNAHSMAYHSIDSLVYLFGGASHKAVQSELWVFTDSIWNEIKTSNAPVPRTFSPLVYDAENNRLMLFGGSKVLFGTTPDAQNLLNDTWEFRNEQWNKLNTENAPSPRAEAMMAYDESRKTIVLFGGYNIQNGEYLKLNDTWEFRDGDWHLMEGRGPSPRHGVSLAYDPEDKSVLLFGGSTIDKQYGENTGETWRWNGKEWSKLQLKQPTGVFNASMVYDLENKEFIRFGGWNGGSRINDTWIFRNNQWDKLETDPGPAPRNHSAMAYDEKHNRTVLFGGHDGRNIFGDTWIFSNHKWEKISGPEPLKRINNGH